MNLKILEPINGKVLVFTDLHLGLKGNSESRLKVAIMVFKEIIEYASKNNIKHIISCGDLFHSRTSIDVNVMNIAYKLVKGLAKRCNVFMLAGNHDIYMKNSTDINSINIFKDIANVTLVDNTAEMLINGKRSLLIPWLGDISAYSPESMDFLFGHFDISLKFLVLMYQNAHKNNTSSSLQLSSDIIKSIGVQQNNEDCQSESFMDIAKKDGIVFSGHIHTRKEMILKGRKLIFIGSPYLQTLGDIGCKCGFYVLDSNMKYSFHEISSVPKHVEIKMSDVVNNIDEYDFSKVKGNIVHKIYDIEVDRMLDTKVSQKILDMGPFEELLPDYEVQVQSEQNDLTVDESIELLKKSKLEYISNYIDNIDDEALKEDNIDKKKLFDILEKYYNEVA